MQRPLMFADELKSMPKGSFVVMKTGNYPMRVKLKLFFQWGIQFGQPLVMAKQDTRPVNYASREDLEEAILKKYPLIFRALPTPERLPDEEDLKEQPEVMKNTKITCEIYFANSHDKQNVQKK